MCKTSVACKYYVNTHAEFDFEICNCIFWWLHISGRRCYTWHIHNCSNLRGLDQGDTRWETAALAPASASVEPASLSHTHCDTCIRMDKSSQRCRREETRYIATATHSMRLPWNNCWTEIAILKICNSVLDLWALISSMPQWGSAYLHITDYNSLKSSP